MPDDLTRVPRVQQQQGKTHELPCPILAIFRSRGCHRPSPGGPNTPS